MKRGDMAPDDFYDARLDQSAVKSAIVSKYFGAWVRVMLPRAAKVAYVDLFSGPGRYGDGSLSTPLMVLNLIAGNATARRKTATFFNDVNDGYAANLQVAIDEGDYGSLVHTPRVSSVPAEEALGLVREQVADLPTLYFVDPWGYKGVTLQLLAETVCAWGCECVLFFNFNRINSALENDLVSEHMDALFGVDTAEALRARLETVGSDEREATVIEGIIEALKIAGAKYVLPFRFVDAHGSRTSHHLVFVTKHLLGYTIMKDIMAGASSGSEQGVPTLEYNPATERQPLLFDYARPLDALGGLLLKDFAGHTMKVETIIASHHVGKRYVAKNYKQVLLQLEAEGKIACSPAQADRNAGTMAGRVVVSFPR